MEITTAGHALVASALPDVRVVQERVLAPLSARERTQLVALLTKIALQNNALSRAPHRLP